MDYNYVLDKLVLFLRLENLGLSRLMDYFRYGAGDRYGIAGKQWMKTTAGSFKDNMTIEFKNGESIFFASRPCLETPSKYFTTCKLEFNPAKVGKCDQFIEFYNFLMMHAKFIKVQRFDLAIDIPIEFSKVRIFKDQRLLTNFEYSPENKTIYLGARSSHGRVKLYNKQLESKLDYPLTRLELTIFYEKCDYKEFKRIFPTVFFLSKDDLMSLQSKICGADFVLCLACYEHDDYIRLIDRKKRKKIESLLLESSQILTPNEILYKSILEQILGYCNSGNCFTRDFEELEDDIDLSEIFPETQFKPVEQVEQIEIFGKFKQFKN